MKHLETRLRSLEKHDSGPTEQEISDFLFVADCLGPSAVAHKAFEEFKRSGTLPADPRLARWVLQEAERPARGGGPTAGETSSTSNWVGHLPRPSA